MTGQIFFRSHLFQNVCLRTIGSKISSWKGRIQDHSTVLGIDRESLSMGAFHASFPVSFRNLLAF